MAKLVKGKEINFIAERSPVFWLGLYEDSTYHMSLDAGWDDSASIQMSKDELIKLRDTINEVLE